jgi:hypothetical protein
VGILDQNNIRLHIDRSRRGVGDLLDRVAKVAFVLLQAEDLVSMTIPARRPKPNHPSHTHIPQANRN